MKPLANISEYEAIHGMVSPDQREKVELLLCMASDKLRQTAMNRGKDIDFLIVTGKILDSVASEVVIRMVSDFVGRAGDLSTAGLSQVTQSALGYSVTGTIAVPGGGLSVMRRDLAALGLNKQTMGVIDLCH